MNAIPNYVQGKSLWLQVAMLGFPSTPGMNKTPHISPGYVALGSENNMGTNPKNGFNFDMNMILQTWIWRILGNVTVSLMEWHSFKRCPITWCWTNIQLQWFICHLWLFIFPMFVRLLSAVVGGKNIYIYILYIYIYIRLFWAALSTPKRFNRRVIGDGLRHVSWIEGYNCNRSIQERNYPTTRTTHPRLS